MSLTGRIRFRLTLMRKLVLMVEYSYETAEPPHAETFAAYAWRDANAFDLADLVALKVLPGPQEHAAKVNAQGAAA